MQYLSHFSLGRLMLVVLTAAQLGACGDDKSSGTDAGRMTRDSGASAPSWSLVLSKEETPWLVSTWGTSTDNRYATGGTLDAGVILHFDGDSWQEEELPDETQLVNWVYGFGEDDIFAVANGGRAMHYDGTEWVIIPTPTEEDLWGVWGAKPDAMWAVGGRGEGDAEATILFYDGTEWSAVNPEVKRPGVHAYFKVWGTAEDNVYVVGQNGVIQHYDGDTWTELNVGASDDLIALWGTGPDNIVAVGGRSSAIVTHFDGKDWNTKTLFQTPGANGVWMRRADTAHLALTQGYLATLSVPKLEVELEPWEDYLDFHAVFGTPDGTLSAVGLNPEAYATMDFQGLLVERKLTDNE